MLETDWSLFDMQIEVPRAPLLDLVLSVIFGIRGIVSTEVVKFFFFFRYFLFFPMDSIEDVHLVDDANTKLVLVCTQKVGKTLSSTSTECCEVPEASFDLV